MRILFSLFFLFPVIGYGQNFTSYFTGNIQDTITTPQGGICLMGGATEDDNAMQWFLQRANGGDVLVLRTSGSNGYNTYLYSSLGVNVNSVETIVCNNSSASYDPYVMQRIQQAEAIWFAGGDQWTYVSSWRNTPVDSLINLGIQQRKIVIGGTSAGMAIQGSHYFSAQNGTVTSATALSNPYSTSVTVDSTSFLDNNILSGIITDTHFDNPDRKGRLSAFLARMYMDYGLMGKAIACDEYAAVCIDTLGVARVFGGYPTYDDNAYFIQANCELANPAPENCSNGNPLTWNKNGQAIKVYQVKGTTTGANTFNLNYWQSGTGGTWNNWSVTSGNFNEQTGNPIACNPLSIPSDRLTESLTIYPNPASDHICLDGLVNSNSLEDVRLYHISGVQVAANAFFNAAHQIEIPIAHLPSGVYFLSITPAGSVPYRAKFVKD
jgi:cyanophycinase-like exopeptidase